MCTTYSGLQPHLLRAHEVFEYEDGFAIIMPYFPRGSLHRATLAPAELKEAVRQILMAVRHLHQNGQLHRDIKPANILVRSEKDQSLDLVVADFGLISLENPVSFCGTKGYTAPEIVRNKRVDKSRGPQYSKAVDIYALGMLILDLLGVRLIKDWLQDREDFDSCISAPLAHELENCSLNTMERHGALSTAERMLQFDPEDRPSADACLRLPWLSAPTAMTHAASLNRAPSTLSAIVSLAGLSFDELKKSWWHSTPKASAPAEQAQLPRLRQRKNNEKSSPRTTSQKHRVQKRASRSLPTPRPTPEKVERAWKSECTPKTRSLPQQKPSQAPNGLLSWDNDNMAI